MNSADILIKNGIIITMDSNDREIKNGALAIKGDSIIKIGPVKEFESFNASKVIDARGGIIMPGLVNTHAHAAMTLFRGLADDLPLMTWLQDYIFPAEAGLNSDAIKKGSLLACAEMILSGTTTFCDMYLWEDSVAEAVKEAGMRAVLGEGLFDFPSPNYGPLEQGFVYTENLLEKWKDNPLITISVDPHSTYLCASDLLTKAASIAKKYNAPIVIHLSETQSEVSQIKKRYGKTPVTHLADLGIAGPDLLAAHCVVLTDEDIRILKDFDIKITHNPESNMKLASGIAPIPRLINEGICVGLGTDGCASNNNLDMFQEMDTAAKLHKVNLLDPTVMDAEAVLKMATINGAKALGLESITGSLEIGKKADVIIIDTNKAHLTPMYHPASHLVYAVNGSDVITSLINGCIVMENRQLLTMNIEKIIADVNETANDFIKH
ncbi:5-methylthioadenosine/S-adenosylhomocysteine deaminase [Candidatus Magnetomoraceae bacterium gMMP-15]